jgi:hypothetical protein
MFFFSEIGESIEENLIRFVIFLVSVQDQVAKKHATLSRTTTIFNHSQTFAVAQWNQR